MVRTATLWKALVQSQLNALLLFLFTIEQSEIVVACLPSNIEKETETMNENYVKDDYIRDIERKLCNNERLTDKEIRTVIAALRESKHCLQEPYYEVVYHDKYDRTESRIMNPDHKYISNAFEPGYCIVEDNFSIDFRRLTRKEEL